MQRVLGSSVLGVLMLTLVGTAVAQSRGAASGATATAVGATSATASHEPAVTATTGTEPAVTEPAVTEPPVTEPAVTEPAVTESTAAASVVDRDASDNRVPSPATGGARPGLESVAVGGCTPAELEEYARRRAFTLRLIEQRERRRFESEVDRYERLLRFTERVARQRSQMAELERKQFEEQVELYTRLREVTQRVQDEHDLQEALRFADELALTERKRAFTRQLMQARAQTPTPDSSE